MHVYTVIMQFHEKKKHIPLGLLFPRHKPNTHSHTVTQFHTPAISNLTVLPPPETISGQVSKEDEQHTVTCPGGCGHGICKAGPRSPRSRRADRHDRRGETVARNGSLPSGSRAFATGPPGSIRPRRKTDKSHWVLSASEGYSICGVQRDARCDGEDQ